MEVELKCSKIQETYPEFRIEDIKYDVLVSCIDVWYPVDEEVIDDLYRSIIEKYAEIIGLSGLFETKHECKQTINWLGLAYELQFKHRALYASIKGSNEADRIYNKSNIKLPREKEHVFKIFKNSVRGIGCFITYIPTLNTLVLQHILVFDLEHITDLAGNPNNKEIEYIGSIVRAARAILYKIAKELDDKMYIENRRNNTSTYLGLTKPTLLAEYYGPGFVEIRCHVLKNMITGMLSKLQVIRSKARSGVDLDTMFSEMDENYNLLKLVLKLIESPSICRFSFYRDFAYALIIPGPGYIMTKPVVRIAFYEGTDYKGSLKELYASPIYDNWVPQWWTESIYTHVSWSLSMLELLTLIELLIDDEDRRLSNIIQKLYESEREIRWRIARLIHLIKDIEKLRKVIQELRGSFIKVRSLSTPYIHVSIEVRRLIQFTEKYSDLTIGLGYTVDIPILASTNYEDANILRDKALLQYLPSPTSLIKYVYERIKEVKQKLNLYQQDSIRIMSTISAELSTVMQYVILILTLVMLAIAIVPFGGYILQLLIQLFNELFYCIQEALRSLYR